MPRILKSVTAVLALLALSGLAFGQETRPAAPNAVPSQVPVASLNDLQGKPVDLQAKDSRAATVYVFVVRDCPISNAYAPEINRTINDFANKRIAFYVVYVDVDAPVADLREHYIGFGYRCPALYDREHRLVKQFKVERTPETIVQDRNGKVLYQGRIDNLYIDFGKSRHLADKHDLRRVLDAVVAGRSVLPTTTPVIGCPVPE